MNRLPSEYARVRLAMTWLVGFAAIVVVAVVLSALKQFEQPAETASWMLPNVLPTLGVVVALWRVDVQGGLDLGSTVSASLFRGAIGFSIFYLALVLIFMISPAGLRETWTIILAALQGVLAGMIGAYFPDSRPQPAAAGGGDA